MIDGRFMRTRRRYDLLGRPSATLDLACVADRRLCRQQEALQQHEQAEEPQEDRRTARTLSSDGGAALTGAMEAEARQSRDDPSTLAELHFDNLLFGDDHPYGRAPTPAGSVTRLSTVLA